MLSVLPVRQPARRKAYPAMLVKTSFNDSQVMYWEPAKYVAKLRTLKTDTNPLLLKINMAAGHGGASGRYDAAARARVRLRVLADRSSGFSSRSSAPRIPSAGPIRYIPRNMPSPLAGFSVSQPQLAPHQPVIIGVFVLAQSVL